MRKRSFAVWQNVRFKHKLGNKRGQQTDLWENIAASNTQWIIENLFFFGKYHDDGGRAGEEGEGQSQYKLGY